MFNVKAISENFGRKLEKKINDTIESSVQYAKDFEYSYTQKDLDEYTNEEKDETLREYIRDTEKEFKLQKKDLENLSDAELNEYIMYLDSLYTRR